MNSEERFFQSVREQFTDFAPEVPQAVYTGMRKKLMWRQFLSFNPAQFNVWYLGLILGGSVALLLQSFDTSKALKAGTFTRSLQMPAPLHQVESPVLTIAAESPPAIVEPAVVAVETKRSNKAITPVRNKSGIDSNTSVVTTAQLAQPEVFPVGQAMEHTAADVSQEEMTHTPVRDEGPAYPASTSTKAAPLSSQLQSSRKEVKLVCDILKSNDTSSVSKKK